MQKILTLMISIILITSCQAQVRLTSTEPSTTKWDIPVGKRAIPGQTGKHFLVYMSLANLMDSVGISAGGATDLSYTGTSGTITLNSSTGTDVNFIAGTGMGLSRTGADMTINSTITQGITSLGLQTGTTQTFATGSTGTDFNISSATNVHTFHIPSASGSNRGLVTTDTQTFAGAKTFSYLGGAPAGGNSLIVADQNGRLENLYGATVGHVPKWTGTAFTLQADATGGITSLNSQTGATQTFSVGNSGTYPSWSSASNIHTYRLPTASSGQVLKYDGTGWAAGTDNGITSAITSLGGQTGATQTFAYARSGTTPSWSSSGNVHTFRLPTATSNQVLKYNGSEWAAGTDDGALPAGASSNTMAYISAAWSTSAFLKNNSTTTVTGNNKRVEINNDTGGEQWPSSINTLTKFLVNGRIQLNSTSSTACTTLMGQNTDMEVGDVTVGNGLAISGGTLSSIDGNFGQLSKSGTSLQSATTSMAKVTFDASVSGGTTATPSTVNEEITIGATGLYEVSFNCANIAGTANRTISFMIYIGGTAITNTLGATTKAANDYTTYHFQEILSLTSGDLINVRMAYDNATGSGTDIYVVSPRLIVKRKT